MKNNNRKKLLGWAIAAAILFLVAESTLSQTPKPEVLTIQLGDQVIRIPAPVGFEEAASQFEKIKNYFTVTEAPTNDMLAVHLPQADCEKLRGGQFGPFEFYTKISVAKSIRGENYSAERFADLVATFRKSGAQILDLDSPTMKGATEHLSKSLSELSKQESQVDFSQPVNLGEFDTRRNVYGVMLLFSIKTKVGDTEKNVPLVGGMSFVRIKQRMIYVYTYRRYESKADVEVLRDFTKQWISQILAAN